MKKCTPRPDLQNPEAEAARELRKLRPFLEGSDLSASPVDADQIPVKPRLASDADVGALMGWPPAATEGIRKARNALLLSLQLATAVGCESVHYSRNRNEFSNRKHNHPDFWTYTNMRAAVESLLTRPDLVCELRARPQNPYELTATRRRSVLFTGPGFIDALVAMPLAVSDVTDHGERIILRDRRKKSLIIPAGPVVEETTQFLAVFDAAVADLGFSFTDPTIRPLSATLSVAIVDDRKILINTDRRFLTRIFTGSMQDGGRLYRTFWQEIPKAMRRSLLIDGAPTAEHDYSACHLRLAYFAVGQRLPTVAGPAPDHYTLDGFGPEWRTMIKRGVSILLNARTYLDAVAALAAIDEMPPWPWEERVIKAMDIVAGILKRHDVLAPLWHTGCGLGLQYVDSQIMMACATELIGRGIVPLPIHDSMLVKGEHLPELKEAMERRFEEDGPRLSIERFPNVVQKKRRRLHDHDLTLGRSSDLVLRALAARARASRSRSRSRSRSASSPDTFGFGCPSTSSTTSADSRNPALDLDTFRCHPVIVDLERVIVHTAWINGGMFRSALLTCLTINPHPTSAARTVRSWVDLNVATTSADVDRSQLEAEILRIMRRAQRPISGSSVARLCGIKAELARELRLAVVIPKPRKVPPSRRAKRMRSTLPRVINIKAAAPWGDPSRRASWFAEHRDPVERQVLALRAILASGDVTAIASARASIARAARERSSLPETRLPVDRLLPRLQMETTVHELRWVPGDIRADDLDYKLGDSRMFISCKTIKHSGDAVQATVKRMRDLLATFTDQPIQILTL